MLSNSIPQSLSRAQPFNFHWLSDVWRTDLRKVSASIDTAWILTRNWHPGLRDELKASGCKNIKIRRIRAPDGTIMWRAWRITKPTERTFWVLKQWKRSPIWNMLLARIDIAVDFTFGTDQGAWRFREWIAEHVHLKWNKANRFWYETTCYWVDHRGKKRPRRSLVMYPKQLKPRTVRLELKLQSTASVRANKLDGLIDYNGLAVDQVNPRELMAKHLSVKELSQHHVNKRVRRAVAWRANNPRIDPDDDNPTWTKFVVIRSLRSLARGGDRTLPTTPIDPQTLLGLVPVKLC